MSTIQGRTIVRSRQATVLLTVAILFAAVRVSDAVDPPNVVVIFVDDMGYADPSCFGNPAMRTPNIDRLATEGIKLTNFYVNSPICSASRVALTTGHYQQRYRIHSFLASRQSNRRRKMPDWLDPDAPTLAKLLRAAGYPTAHFGKWHMGGGRDVGDAPLPQAYGFEESLVSFEGLGDRILWQKTGNQKLSCNHGRGEILDLPKHKSTETYVDRAIEFMRKHRDESFTAASDPERRNTSARHSRYVTASGSFCVIPTEADSSCSIFRTTSEKITMSPGNTRSWRIE